MDDYMFQAHVRSCKNVTEKTSYLEIFNYSDPAYNSIEEHPLTLDEFENFLHRRGVFEPPKLKDGVKLLGGVRIVLQQKAQHPETFTPHVISFTADQYEKMVRVLRLPFRAIEGTAVVGPFFWSAMDLDDVDPHLQIIFRKSDVRKKGKTRGWELMLSYSFRTGITTGYGKGTESSDMIDAINHIKACAAQVGHPMLLPIIVLSHDLSSRNDQKQRDARDWLRKLESAVSMRDEVRDEDKALDLDLDQLNRDLVECHSQVLWKRPQAYLEIVRSMEVALETFQSRLALAPRERGGGPYGELDRLHRGMMSRLDFYRAKLKGVENYAFTTLERLNIQRSALYNVIAQKESKLNLEMAGQQRRLAHASKRDGDSMKTISLLGAIFLPATYLASVFSMTFFDFRAPDGEGMVSSTLWIYFAFSVPMTLIIVACWVWWDKRRMRHHALEDVDLEKGIEKMEAQIMATMRKRTLSKVRTFELGNKAEREKWNLEREKRERERERERAEMEREKAEMG